MSFSFHGLKTLMLKREFDRLKLFDTLSHLDLRAVLPLLRVERLSVLNDLDLKRLALGAVELVEVVLVVAEKHRAVADRFEDAVDVAVRAVVRIDLKAERRSHVRVLLGLLMRGVQNFELLRLEFVERRRRDCDDLESSHAVLRLDLLDVRLDPRIAPNRRFRRIHTFKNLTYIKIHFNTPLITKRYPKQLPASANGNVGGRSRTRTNTCNIPRVVYSNDCVSSIGKRSWEIRIVARINATLH